MIIDYIGTGGAEGVPALFCTCSVCRKARETRGRNIRLRSSVCINKEILIDLSPDIHSAAIAGCIEPFRLQHLLLTHAHEDHCALHQLMYRAQPAFCTPEEDFTLEVYGNAECLKKYTLACQENGGSINHTHFNLIKPFDTVSMGDVTAVALPADHAPGQDAVMYLLEQDGVRFLYAEDTGSFPAPTEEYLRGKYCRAISLDCSFCMGKPDGDSGHLGYRAMLRQLDRLKAIGAADHATRVIAQHFSHNGLRASGGPLTDSELRAMMQPDNITPAYDGMSVEV